MKNSLCGCININREVTCFEPSTEIVCLLTEIVCLLTEIVCLYFI